MVLLLNWQISWVILYHKIQKMYLLPGLAVQGMSTYRAGATENKLNILYKEESNVIHKSLLNYYF